MLTAFHIYSLLSIIKRECDQSTVVEAGFYRKERAAYLTFKGNKKQSLIFSFHPTKHSLYLLPPSKFQLKSNEKPWPMFNLKKAEVLQISQIDFDRILEIKLKVNNSVKYIVIEAIGPNGNIWYLNENREKEATLRKREFEKGEPYTISQLDRLDPTTLTVDAIKDRIKKSEEDYLAVFIQKNITGFNRTLAHELCHRSDLVNYETDELTDNDLTQLISTINKMLDLFKLPENGYLYNLPKGFEAYPIKLSSQNQQPEKYKSLSLALQAASELKHTAVEQVDEEKEIKDALSKAIKKLNKRLKNISSDIETASDYEIYKLYGELLQINYSQIKKGQESIRVTNIYQSDQPEIEIKLDPALSPNENGEAYFKKHRKGREGLELLKRRFKITQDEIKELEIIASELEDHFENASQKYKAEINGLLPKHSEGAIKTERLPYREHTLSTGLTIYIGRDGADNDRTTFDYAKPYELWFHTQQCPGSHVVMKFPNKNFEPSKIEIHETAAIAAYHSKARNDSLVPVIYTERKYVRKPRKAKPGLVTVEREKSVMVEPKPAE